MHDHIKIYISNKALLHDTGTGHPERAMRFEALVNLFKTTPYDQIEQIEAIAASNSDLLRIHAPSHIALLEESSPSEAGEYEYIDGDTLLSQYSLSAAREAAGAVQQAVLNIHQGIHNIGLCPNRPPGHHATYDRAMGFCFFNNVMLGAAKATELGYKRIAVIDFDVHHGNGCTDILQHIDLPCFYISTHQAQHYPGTGLSHENIDHKILNIPLKSGIDCTSFRTVYERDVLPTLANYAPDFMLISAGFDAHRADPYGDFNLIDEDYYWLTQKLYNIAQKTAKSRLVSVLEGGYDIDALASSYAAHINAFID